MNMIGVAQFVTGDIEKQLIRQATHLGIRRASMYDFLEDNVPVSIVVEVSKCDEPFEISPVAVDITGCNQAAEGGQRN